MTKTNRKMPLDIESNAPLFVLFAKENDLSLDFALAKMTDSESADVGDATYDVLVNVSASDLRSKDSYDVCMRKINGAIKTQDVGKYCDDIDYICADVTGWVQCHFDLMKEFCHEFNNDTYQMDVAEEDQYYEEDDPLYVGVLTWEGLVIGNYSDRAYRWLAERL